MSTVVDKSFQKIVCKSEIILDGFLTPRPRSEFRPLTCGIEENKGNQIFIICERLHVFLSWNVKWLVFSREYISDFQKEFSPWNEK